jgi:broad specificity phosphatase PhoE
MHRLILVRHAATADNGLINLFCGQRRDVPIATPGVLVHVDWPFDCVISSTLLRARETAAQISSVPERVTTDARLDEMDFGEWEGLTSTEVKQKYPEDYKKWSSPYPHYTTGPTGGETFIQVYNRVSEFLTSLAQTHAGKTVVLVTHVYVIKAVLDICYGVNPGFHSNRLFLDPGSICIVDMGRDDSLDHVVHRINWTPDLREGVERWARIK